MIHGENILNYLNVPFISKPVIEQINLDLFNKFDSSEVSCLFPSKLGFSVNFNSFTS